MDRREQRAIVEALVLASPEPIPAAKLAAIVPEATASLVRELVAELNADYAAEGRGFEIAEVAGGWQLRTRPELAAYVQELQPRRTGRLSRASLETLAVIAYKQPITRAEIERVRGVDVGAVVRSLLERDLIRIAGHREIAGRPMLYATTKRFLQLFGLSSLEDLPTLRDLRELTQPEDPATIASDATSDADVETATDEEGALFEPGDDVELETDDDGPLDSALPISLADELDEPDEDPASEPN